MHLHTAFLLPFPDLDQRDEADGVPVAQSPSTITKTTSSSATTTTAAGVAAPGTLAAAASRSASRAAVASSSASDAAVRVVLDALFHDVDMAFAVQLAAHGVGGAAVGADTGVSGGDSAAARGKHAKVEPVTTPPAAEPRKVPSRPHKKKHSWFGWLLRYSRSCGVMPLF